MTDFHYVGQELDLFAHATNWKQYWSSAVLGHISGDVLEVGAGLGVNTEILYSSQASSWTCLEPDPNLTERMRQRLAAQPRLAACVVRNGTLADIEAGRKFDTIIYIDVLEHIEHDHDEVARAADLLKRGGKLIVLAPAHQRLFTAFDTAVGHFRRYNRRMLSACSPEGCLLERMFYLDSVGLFASLANALLLRQSAPTLRQILMWDRVMVPISRVVDPLIGRTAGKSIVAVWVKS